MNQQQLIFSLIFIASFSGNADELNLLDGSHLIGKVIHSQEGSIVFKTSFAGEITVDLTKVATLTIDKNVTFITTDGNIIKDQHINEDTQLENIKIINPEPWQLGESYQWNGKANTALQLERGNTDTNQFDLSGEAVWKSTEDRYTLRGNIDIDEADGIKNKDSAKLQGKYDHFFSDPKNYYGFQASVEQDNISNLNLRTIAGPYIGRQLINNHYISLHGEIGLVHVDETYDIADDNDFYGSNWELRLTSDYLGGGSKFYITQDGVLNFDATDEALANMTIGISVPLIYNITAGAEVKYEYDGGAADGFDKMDETYNFIIGYTW